MIPFLKPFATMTPDNLLWVTLLRLSVALICGGIIGLERGKKRRPAGFRTHMLVCVGAALAMLVSQYLSMMEGFYWADILGVTNRTDVARLGAQVINGIGFLGAGTIIVTGRQEVKGLTTAAGLWASACMGLTVGAGFIEGALICCLLISATIIVFSRVERVLTFRARNIHLYVEFDHVDDLGRIIAVLREKEIRIFDVEIHKSKKEQTLPGAVFSIRLPHRMPHTAVVAELAGIKHVRAVEEL